VEDDEVIPNPFGGGGAPAGGAGGQEKKDPMPAAKKR
jgi:hypothetical protein